MAEQIRASPALAPVLDQALGAISALESKQPVDVAQMAPPLQRIFAPQIQGYLMDFFSHDPAKLIAGIGKPILILQGHRDIQISERDARLLKEANSRAELLLLPNVNHVLKNVNSDSRQENLATYADPNLPLADGVVSSIADFVGRAKPQ
jgi:fermentation-respiration switch protein FrsA (DUF1100 family)